MARVMRRRRGKPIPGYVNFIDTAEQKLKLMVVNSAPTPAYEVVSAVVANAMRLHLHRGLASATRPVVNDDCKALCNGVFERLDCGPCLQQHCILHAYDGTYRVRPNPEPDVTYIGRQRQ